MMTGILNFHLLQSFVFSISSVLIGIKLTFKREKIYFAFAK